MKRPTLAHENYNTKFKGLFTEHAGLNLIHIIQLSNVITSYARVNFELIIYMMALWHVLK